MKKRLLVLGLAFTMLAATACGTSSDGGNKTSKADKTVTATSNSDKTSETQKNDDKKDDAKESYKSADDITMDDLKNHEETPAEDFEYADGPDGSVVIEGYTGGDPIVVIPNEIDGKKVMDFGKTFMNNQDIVAVRVGDNVEEIAESAFGNCPSLKYIISGKNVKTVGGGNFAGCTNLKEVVLNDGLESFGTAGRGISSGLGDEDIEVNIPDSVNEIATAMLGYKFKVKAGSYAETFFSQNERANYVVE